MKKFTIPVGNKKSVLEIESGGTKSFVTWERLVPFIKLAIGENDYEEITGFVIDKDGILVDISRKKN